MVKSFGADVRLAVMIRTGKCKGPGGRQDRYGRGNAPDRPKLPVDMDVSRGACVSVKLSNRDVAASGHRFFVEVSVPIERSSQGDRFLDAQLERPNYARLPPQKFAAVRPPRE